MRSMAVVVKDGGGGKEAAREREEQTHSPELRSKYEAEFSTTYS